MIPFCVHLQNSSKAFSEPSLASPRTLERLDNNTVPSLPTCCPESFIFKANALNGTVTPTLKGKLLTVEYTLNK